MDQRSEKLRNLNINFQIFRKINQEDTCRKVTNISIVISVFTVLFLAITREVYAVIVVFLLFLAKGMLLFQTVKYSR